MAALLESRLCGEITAVLSNAPDAAGLAIAQGRGVSTAVIDHRRYTDRTAFEAALVSEIDHRRAELVVLAGFMRLLTEPFVRRYSGRILNIHPSLLPAFPGLHTHRRALAAGVRIHGCTVHFVTADLDHGPIVAQAAVPVFADDTEERLSARVLAQEHRIYPAAVRWFCEERLTLLQDGRVHLDGEAVETNALLYPPADS
jgi:phosphoribosylglycinamide formyltransferase-1